ncbi:SET domain-containing protein, putative [Eimeria mitis]|uniref:SET domain-containing protein, putative n=1 Tax=Eimeria mitis TaxID=44415 RepID=U6K724_9EIME|nr:SET domain-containing protein, putative [Eimeria mitis]CDJ32636.1 SET domain-containing protein, putative [Eimeria mitis]
MIPAAENPLPDLPRNPDGSFLPPGALLISASRIPDAGLGLFAGEGIRAGTWICEYIGEKKSLMEIMHMKDRQYVMGTGHINCHIDATNHLKASVPRGFGFCGVDGADLFGVEALDLLADFVGESESSESASTLRRFGFGGVLVIADSGSESLDCSAESPVAVLGAADPVLHACKPRLMYSSYISL